MFGFERVKHGSRATLKGLTVAEGYRLKTNAQNYVC